MPRRQADNAEILNPVSHRHGNCSTRSVGLASRTYGNVRHGASIPVSFRARRGKRPDLPMFIKPLPLLLELFSSVCWSPLLLSVPGFKAGLCWQAQSLVCPWVTSHSGQHRHDLVAVFKLCPNFEISHRLPMYEVGMFGRRCCMSNLDRFDGMTQELGWEVGTEKDRTPFRGRFRSSAWSVHIGNAFISSRNKPKTSEHCGKWRTNL